MSIRTRKLLGTVALLSAYVNTEIRDGLVDARVDRALQQSANDVATAQKDIDASTAENPGDLQTLVRDVATKLGVLGGDARRVVILQSPSNTSPLPVTAGAFNPSLVAVVTDEMRQAARFAWPKLRVHRP